MPDLTAPRQEDLRVEVIPAGADLTVGAAGPAPRVLEQAENFTLKGGWLDQIGKGGTLDLTDPGDIPWGSVLLRIIYRWRPSGTTQDWTEYPLGVYYPATPTGDRRPGARRRTVELYDTTLALHDDHFPETFVVMPGQRVTDIVAGLVESVGLPSPRLGSSDEVVRIQTSWPAGETKLKAVNDLLASIGFIRITAGWDGVLFSRNDADAQEPVAVLTDVPAAGLPYENEFTDELDLYSVPNRWIGIARSDGDTPGMVSVAENTDPESPTSFPSRGRWVSRTTEDVEASSQEVLDSIILGNLTAATNATREVKVSHPVYPGVELRELVEFHNTDHGVHLLGRVTHLEWDLSVPAAMCRTTLREVQAL